MPNCVNINHEDFLKLRNETDINSIILSAKISIWQEKTGIINRFPTKEEIENKETLFKKEKITNIEYQKSYSIFSNSSNVENTLNEILKNPKSRTIETTAKWLLDNINLNNVKVNLSNNLGQDISGQFSIYRNEIDIKKDFPYSEGYFQRVFLHEAVHSLTSLPIKTSLEYLRKDFIKLPNGNYKINENSFKILNDIDKDTRLYIERLFNIRNEAYQLLVNKYGKAELDQMIKTDPSFYGLTNITEFIAEIFTNDNFKREVEIASPNIFDKIIKSIINWLNKFGFNFSLPEKETNISKAIEAVIKYTNTKSPNDFEAGFSQTFKDKDHNVIFYKKDKIILNSDTLDFSIEKEKIPSLSRIEQQSFVQSMIANAVNYFYNPSDKIGNSSVKETIKKDISVILENGTNEQKILKEKFENEFENLWKKSINNINRIFGTDFREDAELNETELEKEYEQSLISNISSSESASSGVKWFILSTPKLNEDGTKIINPFTGLTEFIDPKEVFPTMLERLTKATSANNLINILKDMSLLNSSYGLMAERLSNNIHLLNMFRSEFTKIRTKSILNTIIEKDNGSMEIKTFDSFNKSRPVQQIRDEWNTLINYNIGETEEENYYKSLEYNKKYAELDTRKIKLRTENQKEELSSNNILTERGKNISNLLFSYSKLIGNTHYILSKEATDNIVKNSRNLEDIAKYFDIYSRISSIVTKGDKSNIDSLLLNLADEEEKFRSFDIEVMQTNLHGKPIFPFVLPSMLTKLINKFNTASQSKEIKEELENEFKKWSEEPARQFDNLFWNQKDETGKTIFEGFVNYNTMIQENTKFPLKVFESLNYDLLRTLTVSEMEGTKNETTKEGLQYSEMSEVDYSYSQLLYYLGASSERSKERGRYVYLPIAIPSDSGRTCLLKVPRIPLHTNKTNFTDGTSKNVSGFDITKDKPFVKGKSNKLFIGLYRTALQEIQRIKQANNLIFNEELLKIGKFSINEDLKKLSINDNESKEIHNEKVLNKIGNFVQYYHYRELKYNSEGKIDIEKTFIKNERPTGNVFYFTNMVIDNSSGKFKTNKFWKERTKDKPTSFVTLSDIEGFTVNGALTSLIENNLEVMEDFIQEFSKQEVRAALKDFSEFEADFTGKTDFIGDGSFKDFIIDFTLNEYIHYVNCQTFFTGVTPFYKNINDISKRAKQIIAPGRAASDLGVSEFKAITISDCILTSNTINEIKEKIKKVLKKEKSFENEEDLDREAEEIIKPYRKINIGDAQGYITVKGLKELLIKHGRMNPVYEKMFKDIENGSNPDIKTIKTLQAIKPFQYDYNYDSSLNLTIPSQVKLSYAILLPQFVNGTELEELKNEMEKKDISRAFFESAHKVGARFIHKIHNLDGKINKESLSLIQPQIYKYDSEQIQLEVPTHLEDDTNKLATQIAKLIVANLSDDVEYKINNKSYNGAELRDHYFRLLVQNIEEETQNLMTELEIKETDGVYHFNNKNKLKEFLEDEIINRGLSENYDDAIQLNENGEFVLPLFINNMSKKWESILTSLFSNRIMRQKMPGGSVILTSTFGLNKIEQSKSEVEGIQWAESHKEDHTLKIKTNSKGETLVEVVMGSWSKKFFNGDKRISINEIPEELRQIIGYRIPTQAKHSMIVLEVVGFLPEQSKGMIITPDDLVVQMGSDFDIDKLFLMYKSFSRTKNGKFIIPKYNENRDLSELDQELAELEEEYHQATKQDQDLKSEVGKDLLNFGGLFEESLVEIEDEIKYLKYWISIKKGEEGLENKSISKAARNNEIIDIYKAILTNPFHQKEIFTPAEFEELNKGKEIIESIYKIDDSSSSPVTGRSQRRIRERNIAGRTLKGIAANYNAFGAISQISKMKLVRNSAFVSKVKISGKETEYDKVFYIKELENKYGKENVIIKDEYAEVYFTGIGFNESKNYYLNIDNKVITENASQGIGAAVDNAKNPIFDALNLTIFTYPVFHSSLLLGQSTNEAMFFYRQPIIVKLNKAVENNKSIRSDNPYKGRERELVRKIYKNRLFKVYYNNFKERLDKKIGEFNNNQTVNTKNKIYTSEKLMSYLEKNEEATVPMNLFDYLFKEEENKRFSTQELYNMLEQDSLDLIGKLEPSNQIKLYMNQLMILQDFNVRKESSEKIDNVIKITKTDSIGAGPEINTSTKLIEDIIKSENDNIVQIDGVAAVKKIYPKFFRQDEKSKYPPIQSFFENVNRLSRNVLRPLFINESISFKSFKNDLFETISTTQQGKRDIEREADKFLNYLIYQDFPGFEKDLHMKRVLGISSSEKYIDGDLLSFKKQSFFDKVKIIQEIYANFKGNHVVNLFETPNTFSKNGYKEVTLRKYKDSALDTIYSEQLAEMYETDDLQKEFVEDLIRYTYFKNSLDFNFESAAKIIPNKVLIDLKMGDFLYNFKELSDKNIMFNKETIDQFVKNNWFNKTIAPSVRTKFEKDDRGNILKDKDNNLITLNNTPTWDYNPDQGFLVVLEEQLENEKKNIKYSNFIIINKQDGNNIKSHLLKKLNTKEVFELIGEDFSEDISTFLDINSKKQNVYYYEINKLGKNGIYETGHTVFAENPTINEGKNYKNALINYWNLDKNTEGLIQPSLEKIEEIKNNCSL